MESWLAFTFIVLLSSLTILASEISEQNPHADSSDLRVWPESDQQPGGEQEREVADPSHALVADPEGSYEEIPPPRRIRPRPPNKRRRRMRKRPRTTTPLPAYEELEEAAPQEGETIEARQTQEEPSPTFEEPPPVRRRPGKRRRRPLRRYQERRPEYQDEEVPRKRRKGGRKRLRPIELPEEEPVVNSEPEATPESATVIYEEAHQEQAPEVSQEIMKTVLPETPDVTPSTEIIPQTTTKPQTEEVQTINPQLDWSLQSKDIPIQSTEQPKNETNENKTQTNTNEVFDRKRLFPSSRRLPPTSAVIRRRLRPKDKVGKTDLRNEVLPKALIPDGFTTAPEVISPTQLINELKSQSTSEREEEVTTEEPNYPKMFPKIVRTFPNGIREQKVENTIAKNNMTEHASVEWGVEPDKINATILKEESSTSYKSIVVKTDETLKYEALDIPNVKDDILDLLKSDSGSSRLSRILELRNMTLVELIEHRERGSSQLHLSDIFHKKNSTTSKDNQSEERAEERAEKPSSIAFPSDEIMGSFPKFLFEQIGQKNFTTNGSNETREPRTYEDEPNKTNLKLPPYPTWKILGNPKLTPVSVRGEYEEIILTKYQSTGKPDSTDSNEIVLSGENEVPILRNDIGGHLSAEGHNVKNDRIGFRRIPPGMKSTIIVSGAILVLAIFGFLSVLISCRVRQRRARLRAKQDILCEHLQNEEFMNSQRSLSPVLTKTREPVFTQGIHSNTTSNRHYYLWRTLRKTFQYD